MPIVNCNLECVGLKEALIASLELSQKLVERAEAAEKDRDLWQARWKKHQGIFKAIEDLDKR